MIPSKRRSINLRKCESPPIVRILHILELVVETAVDGVVPIAIAIATIRLLEDAVGRTHSFAFAEGDV